jgi:hypothetical protein
MTTISWLHLTDLHIGIHDDSWLWPGIKHDFYRDLEEMRRETGGWDLVFFTGDLTQRGSKEEFDRVDVELRDLWRVLAGGGSGPSLCVVPGNHDLLRPDPHAAVVKTLSRLWWEDTDLRQTFWREQDGEHRRAIAGYFDNYVNWLRACPVPLVEHGKGLLPGDFSATYVKDGIRLGLVGLNTAFLQVTGGDFEGKLDLHVRQLQGVCDRDAAHWVAQRDATLLLTHHPSAWLHPSSLDHFRQEVYPPGRFLAHFCGHQHESMMADTSEAGATHRRVRQGSSLLGLENWEDAEGAVQKRIHGYSCGQFLFNGGKIIEKVWPRIALKGRHGALNLRPDHTYTLVDDCVVTTIESERDFAESLTPSPPPNLQGVEVENLQLLDAAPEARVAKERLVAAPRLQFQSLGAHRSIRLSEQTEAELNLRRSRNVWIRTDWGMGTHEFIAAVTERFGVGDSIPEMFIFRCEELSEADGIESSFHQQFAMTLPLFCSLVSTLGDLAVLIVDGVPGALAAGDDYAVLKRIVRAVMDYCPAMRIVMTSRFACPDSDLPHLELRPLEVPEVRNYLVHCEGGGGLRDAETIEAIHDRSDGLPVHIDKIVKALSVASLEAALAKGASAPDYDQAGEDSTALKETIAALQSSQDRRSRRSFRMLKVFSILSYGETIETLHHYLPAEPFFEENALQLRELGLLDVVQLRLTSARRVAVAASSVRNQDGPKLLRVPRPVRDHLHGIVSKAEAEEIAIVGIDLFFGRRWRDGTIKLRKVPIEHREYLSTVLGNEFALLMRLMGSSAVAEARVAKRSAKLCLEYMRRLSHQSRYRDLVTVGGSLLQMVRQ